MEFPLVTFISPCYNHSKYIIESLDSIRNQSYPNIEHIIIDDCSKDDSVAIIEEWIKKHNYRCTFIRHSKNRGLSYTLNESIRMSKGEFWTPAATDDFMVPGRTLKFVQFLQKNPTCLMVVSDTKMINSHSEPIKINGYETQLSLCIHQKKEFSLENDFGTYTSLMPFNYIPSSLMCRRKVFDIVGLYNEKLQVEDWEMWLRISLEKRIGLIKECLTFYRVHDTNTIKNFGYLDREFLITFLIQYKPSKKGGYSKEYEELYENFYFKHYFNPLKNYKFIWLFIYYGPPWLFAKIILKKIRRRFFNKKPISVNFKKG